MSTAFQRIATHSRGIKWTILPCVRSSGTPITLGPTRIHNLRTLSTQHSQILVLDRRDYPGYLRPINTIVGLTNTTPVCLQVLRGQRRGFASRKESSADASLDRSEEEEFVDDNGMTMKDREKIEKWTKYFTKESIPKGLLTLNFVRSSGPGGQNVNKVNTKVDMRFVVNDAAWLPEYVRDRLNSEESNRINKSGEYVLSSDRKRTQMANLDDCLEKLHKILIKMAELPKLPDAETLEKLERIRKAGNNRRKVNKQFQSQKKSSRRVSRDD
ncbi:hypothetical protein BGX27_005590 [Mortierella sp. AM989]|nr:hypothetical protein BGX27_005590 [Mortierella sp. AM989]